MTADPISPVPLDADELLRTAIEASRLDRADDAFELLQRSVRMRHANPIAHYLLGAEHAQAGRHGDAVLHFTTAVEQAPELFPARLQLGLLWLTLQNPKAALAVLEPLRSLPPEDALQRFGDGIARLASDDLRGAAAQVKEGLRIGCDNQPLMRDMQMLVDRIGAALDSQGATSSPLAQGEPSVAASLDMAISAYTRRDGNGA